LKAVELRLVAELLKNSRRSDRELAKVLGVSQPTVSRTMKKLEEQGVIKEYTIVPDFSKLGFQIMGVSFIKLQGSRASSPEDEAEQAGEVEKSEPYAPVMGVSGQGLGKDRMFITFYKDYGAYLKAMQVTKQLPFIDVDTLDSFLVDLTDKNQYRPLSMSRVSKYILSQAEAAANQIQERNSAAKKTATRKQ